MASTVLSLLVLLQVVPDGVWNLPCPAPEDAAGVLAAAEGRATASAIGDERGWTLTVRFESPSLSERTLRLESCDEAARAATVLLRLGLRSAPRRVRLGYSPSPAVTAVAATGEGTEAPSWRPSIALSGVVASGTLPVPTVRAGVSLGLLWAERWLGLFSIRSGLPSTLQGGPNPEAFVVLQPLVNVALGACWAPQLGVVQLGPCLSAGVETMWVSGHRVDVPRQAVGVTVQTGLDLRGALRLWSGLSLVAAVGGRVSVLRPAVSFGSADAVFVLGLFAAEAELALKWDW